MKSKVRVKVNEFMTGREVMVYLPPDEVHMSRELYDAAMADTEVLRTVKVINLSGVEIPQIIPDFCKIT